MRTYYHTTVLTTDKPTSMMRGYPRQPEFPRRKWKRLGCVSFVAVLALMSGCGEGSGGTADNLPSPGQVAVAYTTALANGNFAEARGYVVVEDRGIIDALALTASKQHTSADVSVGLVDESGDTAVVSLVGRLCRSSPGESGDDLTCVTNENSTAAPPAFTVYLERQTTGVWQISLHGL